MSLPDNPVMADYMWMLEPPARRAGSLPTELHLSLKELFEERVLNLLCADGCNPIDLLKAVNRGIIISEIRGL